MAAIKSIANKLFKKGKMYVYHKEKNEEAYKIMKTFESVTGKLNPKNKRLCKEYAFDVFGDKKYAPWLMTYCSYSHQFKEGWIPDNYYGEYVVPALKGEYGTICNRTSIINKLLNDKNSVDLGYYINNLFLNTSNKVLYIKDFKKLLFENNKRVVFKTENSFQGKGIYFFDKNTFDLKLIKQLGNGVFQSYIFNQFNDTAVATIRLTSVSKSDGEIEVRAGYFKFAGKNDTHVKSASALYITLNVDNGQLHNKASLPDWAPVNQLPNNDLEFAGMQLPAFNQCISEVKRMHKLIPYIRCIGWDLILDEQENVRIIELNGLRNTISLHEIKQGPCFKGLNWENLIKLN